jgi:hypothetical protein
MKFDADLRHRALVVYPLFAALVLGFWGNRGRIAQLLGSFPISPDLLVGRGVVLALPAA